jgi:hypothetical protein
MPTWYLDPWLLDLATLGLTRRARAHHQHTLASGGGSYLYGPDKAVTLLMCMIRDLKYTGSGWKRAKRAVAIEPVSVSQSGPLHPASGGLTSFQQLVKSATHSAVIKAQQPLLVALAQVGLNAQHGECQIGALHGLGTIPSMAINAQGLVCLQLEAYHSTALSQRLAEKLVVLSKERAELEAGRQKSTVVPGPSGLLTLPLSGRRIQTPSNRLTLKRFVTGLVDFDAASEHKEDLDTRQQMLVDIVSRFQRIAEDSGQRFSVKSSVYGAGATLALLGRPRLTCALSEPATGAGV